MLHDDDFTIIAKYGVEYRGLVQYYLLARNVFRLDTLHWIMETWMLKTLVNEHQSTVSARARARKGRPATLLTA
ncbi:group II intron reverse transcriptase/maturase [[Actinomadura] parvosata]|uniref:group II intron reverse transcriptase/maturase n=1 Tax=[Actinomadura] parvosata TaxID=1955412 RepID=UPI00406D3D82